MCKPLPLVGAWECEGRAFFKRSANEDKQGCSDCFPDPQHSLSKNMYSHKTHTILNASSSSEARLYLLSLLCQMPPPGVILTWILSPHHFTETASKSPATYLLQIPTPTPLVSTPPSSLHPPETPAGPSAVLPPCAPNQLCPPW